MLYANSHASRRIVGRFDKGENLVDALLALCAEAGVSVAQVNAHGIVTHVDLATFDPARREYTSVLKTNGVFELVSLQGSISTLGRERVLHAHALLSYASHGQLHQIGGQLRSATVYAVEFVIDVFEDLDAHRGLDSDTGLPLWKSLIERPRPRVPTAPVAAAAPEPERPRAPRPAERDETPAPPQRAEAPRALDGRRTVAVDAAVQAGELRAIAASPVEGGPLPSRDAWREAARRSQELLEGGPDEEQGGDEAEVTEGDYVELAPGDILLHPRLGECTVVRVEDDVAAYIRITKSQRVSKLALGVVRLEPLAPRGNNRVFRVHAGE